MLYIYLEENYVEKLIYRHTYVCFIYDVHLNNLLLMVIYIYTYMAAGGVSRLTITRD